MHATVYFPTPPRKSNTPVTLMNASIGSARKPLATDKRLGHQEASSKENDLFGAKGTASVVHFPRAAVKPPKPPARARKSPTSYRHPSSSNSPRKATLGRAFGASLLLGMVGSGAAYPCFNGGATSKQFFIGQNPSLFGMIQGEIANCEITYYYCGQQCSRDSCYPSYCRQEEVTLYPEHYVRAAMTLIEKHNFTKVNWLPTEPLLRVANPRLEKNLWVSIFVNEYNETDKTNPSLFTLAGLV